MAFQPRKSSGKSNSSDNKGGEGNGRRNTSTFTGYNSYDNTFSALTFKQFNQAGMIELSPINPEMIGKQPKKGEKVYDHESKLALYITAEAAITIINGIDTLQEALDSEEEGGDQIKNLDIELGNEVSGRRTLSIYVPGRTNIKRGGTAIDLSENYFLRVTIEKEGEVMTGSHILQNRSLSFKFTKSSSTEEADQVVYTDLLALKEFCKTVIMSAMNVVRHGTAQVVYAQSSGSSAKETKKKFGDVDIDDEENVEEEGESENTSSTNKGSSKARAAATSLEEEFAEDDDIPQ